MRGHTRSIIAAALLVAVSGCGGDSDDGSIGGREAAPNTALTVKSSKGWDYNVEVDSLKLSFQPTQPGFSELRVNGKAKITNKSKLPSPDTDLLISIIGLYDMSSAPSQSGRTNDGRPLFAAREGCEGLPLMDSQTVAGRDYCMIRLGLVRNVKLDGGASDDFEVAEAEPWTVRDADVDAVAAYLSKPPYWILAHAEGFAVVMGQPVKG